MLQWMGGSRRKVTTSRRSTHKRQKQYFEQRKRQQQYHNVGTESYADRGHTCEQHQKEHRSLDVLNLLNLSTIAHECKSSCPSRREDPVVSDSKMKHCVTRGPPTSLTNKVNSAYSDEMKESRILSGYQEETVTPKVASLNARESYNHSFNGTDNEANLHKTATEQHKWQELSVFELLGDDQPIDNSERSPINEDHVSFSLEGLGNVGTTTPIHSPQQPYRVFHSACSLPWKAAGRLNSSKSFNQVLDDIELEVDTNLAACGSSFCFSTDMENSHRNWNQKLSTIRDHIQFDVHGSNMNSPFGDPQIFNSVGNSSKDIWDGIFLDDDYLDEREEDIAFQYGDYEIPGYAFHAPCVLKKRGHTRAADKFNILDQRKSGKDHDLRNLGGRRYVKYFEGKYKIHLRILPSCIGRHPVGGGKFNFRDVTSQPDWSCFANEDANWSCFADEDAKDNLSLLSEESCSSTAVRGVETNNSPSKSTATQSGRHGHALGNLRNTCGVKNTFAKESQYENMENILQSKNACGSGKCPTTNVPKSKRHCFRISPFKEKLESPKSWLLGDGYAAVALNSDLHSFHQSSGTKLPTSSKLWTEETFDAKSSLHRSKHGGTIECSPSGSFISEKLSLGQTFSPINSHDSPTFSKIGLRSVKLDSSPDTGFKGIFPDSSHVTGPHRETPCANLSEQGSVSRDEDPVNYKKNDSGKQNNDSVSEKKEVMDVSNSNDNGLECNEAKDRAVEQKETLENSILSEHGEETSSSSVKIPHELKCKSRIDKKEYHHNTGIGDTCQKGREGKEDPGRDVNSNRQVMMLGSYVLQLLCVQKVEKTLLGTPP